MGESHLYLEPFYRAMLTLDLSDGAEEGDPGIFTPAIFN
jgi:hypothetical protein